MKSISVVVPTYNAASDKGIRYDTIGFNWGGLSYRKFDNMHAVASISKNIELLGWRSKISMEEGLRILKADILSQGITQ